MLLEAAQFKYFHIATTTDTLHSCTLFQKLHLTEDGKITVLDDNNPSRTCTFAYICLHPH